MPTFYVEETRKVDAKIRPDGRDKWHSKSPENRRAWESAHAKAVKR